MKTAERAISAHTYVTHHRGPLDGADGSGGPPDVITPHELLDHYCEKRARYADVIERAANRW